MHASLVPKTTCKRAGNHGLPEEWTLEEKEHITFCNLPVELNFLSLNISLAI